MMPIPIRSRTRSRSATRTDGSTIRARASAAITATGRASWCRPSIRRQETGRRRGRRRQRQDPRKRLQAHREQRACLRAGRPAAAITMSSRKTARSSRPTSIESRPTQSHSKPMPPRRRAQAQEHVWNEVWKRRIVYFATVGATLWLFVFPCCARSRATPSLPIRSAGCRTSFAWSADSCPALRDLDRRLCARAGTFLFLLALVVFLIWLGGKLASRISVRMGSIWRGYAIRAEGSSA